MAKKKAKKKTVPEAVYCKDCKNYTRGVARCTFHNIYVARKNSCDNGQAK